jgi:hypothetical protein
MAVTYFVTQDRFRRQLVRLDHLIRDHDNEAAVLYPPGTGNEDIEVGGWAYLPDLLLSRQPMSY